MTKIEPFEPSDKDAIIRFVAAIQEHELVHVPELKSGSEIATGYADVLFRTVSERNGIILMARESEDTIGFVCAWIGNDDDPLIQEKFRSHAYVSDIFVTEKYRRHGVAQALLKAIEAAMFERGCLRVRICSKAANVHAIQFYKYANYQPYEVTFSKTLSK